RSKLTRRHDPALAALYRRLLRVRRELPRGDVDAVRFEDDEAGRWLLVRRGPFELACNFAATPARVPVSGGELVLATHADAAVAGGHAALPPLAGAFLR
ncbi:MAG TPA: DUF3459 domain-containing protein, partial [Solirubrobacteraceae bacterium]|nr:DUF3459 domain-containing protein [Solirubrobacteraceae bacterium]